jgi:hypothetical protein
MLRVEPRLLARRNFLELSLGSSFCGAQAIDEKALGPDHPSTAIDVTNLASLLEAKGDLVGAEALLR